MEPGSPEWRRKVARMIEEESLSKDDIEMERI
jgi:hypothetical protein